MTGGVELKRERERELAYTHTQKKKKEDRVRLAMELDVMTFSLLRSNHCRALNMRCKLFFQC